MGTCSRSVLITFPVRVTNNILSI